MRVQSVGDHYVTLDDGTVWPRPGTDLEWQMRYGDALEHRLSAASAVAAFNALCAMPRRRRDKVCRLLAAIEIRPNGAKRRPEYNTWKLMRRRCHVPTRKDYRLYGARGIRVCDRWNESFWAFLKDMGPRPSAKHSIDRIDVNGNYEPGNCRWATNAEQGRNRRSNVWVLLNGQRMCVADAEAALGVSKYLVNSTRRSHGFSHQEAVDYLAAREERRRAARTE